MIYQVCLILAAIKSTFIREFFCSVHSLSLEGKGSSSLELYYLPFDMHLRYCAIILSNKEVRTKLGLCFTS
jgi:hypothetical protein